MTRFWNDLHQVRSKSKVWKDKQFKEEFEDTKGATRIVYRRRTDNTMAKRKRTTGQTTIYKTYT